MTEQHCDDYLNKYAEITIACENPLTTKTQLETLLAELKTIDDLIVAESPTVNANSYIDKFVEVKVIRITKINLLNCLESLYDVKKQYANNITDYNGRVNFTTESNEIYNYVEDVVTQSCECMKAQKQLIKNQIKKNK